MPSLFTATVELAATLDAPVGEIRVVERRVTRGCPAHIADVLARYGRSWKWEDMKPTVSYGRFGHCHCDRCWH